MSLSASTTRMFKAMRPAPAQNIVRIVSLRRLAASQCLRRRAGEAHRYARSAALLTGEQHFAAMLLDNLVHDRETQPGALLARRDIGLDDALAIGREANAIVRDRNFDELVLSENLHLDFASIIGVLSGGPGVDRLDRVLEDIGCGLPELMPVAGETGLVAGSRKRKIDVGPRDFLQEQG